MVVTEPSTVMISEREQFLILDQSRPGTAHDVGIDHRSTSGIKISLFRSLGKDLDSVLDTVLRAMAHRARLK